MPSGYPGSYSQCIVVEDDERCPNLGQSRGWCPKHYARWKKHGDPLVKVRRGWPWNFEGQQKRRPNGCLGWTGKPSSSGYGIVRHADGRDVYVHVVAWERVNGPVPPGYQVDHICHNEDPTCNDGDDCLHRTCVEPSHLVAKPQRDNILAGKGPCAVNARKTRCIRGHLFDEENTYWRLDGGRTCRACRRLKWNGS